MITLSKVQAVSKAYKNVSLIERAKPVSASGLETESQSKNFQSQHDSQKSFAKILKDKMEKS